MNYRRIGNTGTKISEISLGAWLTYGKSVDDGTAERIIKTAVDNGVNFIDIADIYARGEAEKSVGKAIKGMNRQHLVISSKVFWPMSDDVNDRGLSRKHIVESIDNSLKRIGTDYLDLYFCHRFDPDTEIEEVVRAMDDLVRQGKVVYWGTSVWSAEQIERAVGNADRWLCYAPKVEQSRYNMLDRHIEEEILPTCDKHGIGLVVWSPLAQGLLTGKYSHGRPSGSRGGESEWLDNDLTPENIEKVKKLGQVASDIGCSMSQLALAWILRLPQISCAITGATKEEQLLDNINASDVTLSPEILERIDAILSS